MYEQTGLRVLAKYKELTKNELTEFFHSKVTFVVDSGLYNEEMATAPYKIWSLDWKKDTIEVLTADAYTKYTLTREYGYVFDLDKDVVEVYEQAETEEEKNKITYLITRDNIEKVAKKLEPKLREDHGLSDQELLECHRKIVNKDY